MKNKVCQYCVMDDSVATLLFDDQGRCNACKDAEERLLFNFFPNEQGRRNIEAMVASIRRESSGKHYDCMVGLSGGIDSAYLAHYAVRELGLKVLAVHVDGGWNSEPAVRNIESIVKTLGIDLHTIVIEWQEMRDLQVSFLKAGVVNQDIPQDHAFFSSLHRAASEFGIRSFLSGVNLATECVEVPDGGHTSLDGRHLTAIHEEYGNSRLDTFPVSRLAGHIWRTRISKSVVTYKPLNWIEYSKSHAVNLLKAEYDWADYGTKHSESRFTKFYQEIFLPKKLGFDKRRVHLSSGIVSGEMSREEAIKELSTPIIDEREAVRDTKFIARKLGLEYQELKDLINKTLVSHKSYKNDLWLQSFLLWGQKVKNTFLK